MKKHIVYLDYLRVFSAVAVIILHVATTNWNAEVISEDWPAMNFYNGIVRWGVPCFCMISGALFIPREISLKNLYGKNILRLTVSYGVWSLFYASAMSALNYIFEDKGTRFATIIKKAVNGHYHLWFIPMIIGLYMCLPLFQKLCESRKSIRYYLCLSFVFAFFLPELFMILSDFGGARLASLIAFVKKPFSDMHLDFLFGFGFFFMLGHYLNTTDISNKHRKIIYFAGFIGFASTVLLNALLTKKTDVPVDTYFGECTVHVLLEVVSVFCFLKYRKYQHEKINTIIRHVAKWSFGAYLVHALIISVFNFLGMNSSTFIPMLSIPLISIAVTVLSFSVSGILNLIPVVKKWVV